MEYVNLGKAGVKVSQIALGMGLREQQSAEEAVRLVHHAIDSGVNFIDCANIYGIGNDLGHKGGTSEEILGQVLKTRRDDVVVTSKVYSLTGPGPNDRGASRLHILREIDNSLRRLRTDHVDVYLLHHYDQDTPLEETVRALDDLVRQGKTRYVGCCNHSAWQVCKSLWTSDRLGANSLVCVQNPYNLLDRSAEGELFGIVRDQGLGLMAYSPLAVGLLSGAYAPGQNAPTGSLWSQKPSDAFESALPLEAGPLIDALQEIAAQRGKTVSQVALNWVLSHAEVTAAITGADTIERLDENLGAIGWTLDAEELARLNELSAFRR